MKGIYEIVQSAGTSRAQEGFFGLRYTIRDLTGH